MDNSFSTSKTDTFRFQIDPDVRAQIEAVYAKDGITLTQAIHIFIQQSLHVGGFPFQVDEENEEFAKAKALERLMHELELGKSSGEAVEEEEVYRMLGVTPE
jgi:DNA-damage-inducible protein J